MDDNTPIDTVCHMAYYSGVQNREQTVEWMTPAEEGNLAGKAEAKGLRTYRNAWGTRTEDTTRCVETVCGNSLADIGSSHQCNRKRGHGPSGEYCKQHAAIRAKYDAK